MYQRHKQADTRAKGNHPHDRFGRSSHERRGLTNGMLPGRPLRPAGDLDSYCLRGFKQRINSQLMVMVLDVYLMGLE